MTSNDHTTTGAATRPAGQAVPPPPPPATGNGSTGGGPTGNGSTGSTPANGAGTSSSGVRNSAARAAAAAVAAARSAAQRVATVTVSSEDDIDESTVKRVPGSGSTPAGAAAGSPSPGSTPQGQPAGGSSKPAGQSGTSAPRSTPSVPPRPTGSQRTAPATAAPAAPARPVGDPGVRRVRLVVSRIDPWSVMKLSFILATAIGIMTVVAIAMFWGVLNGLGVFTQINSLIIGIVGEETEVDVLQFVAFDRVLALGTLVAIVNIVLMTAIATILSFIYNIVAAVVGGIHLTLTDE